LDALIRISTLEELVAFAREQNCGISLDASKVPVELQIVDDWP
jgi:hypothetical protein